METDPTTHGTLVTAKNKACDGKFIPFVKMMKGMNRHADEPIQPSFLIEVMGLSLVLPPFGRYRDEIRFFLATVAERITEAWADPAGVGPDVNGNVSISDRNRAAAAVRVWLSVAEEALLLENDGRERAAVEKWKDLFGWRMPRP